MDAYRHEERNAGCVEQAKQRPLLKARTEPPAAIYPPVAQDGLKRLDRAYQNFFRIVKAGPEKPGFPASRAGAVLAPSPTPNPNRLDNIALLLLLLRR
jgi:hypothetical protein